MAIIAEMRDTSKDCSVEKMNYTKIRGNAYVLLVVAPLLLWFIFGVSWVTSSSLYLDLQHRLVPAPGFSINVLWMLGIWMTVAMYPCILYLTLMIKCGGSTWRESLEAMGPFLVLCPLIGFFGVALLLVNGIFKIMLFSFMLALLVWYPSQWIWRKLSKK